MRFQKCVRRRWVFAGVVGIVMATTYAWLYFAQDPLRAKANALYDQIPLGMELNEVREKLRGDNIAYNIGGCLGSPYVWTIERKYVFAGRFDSEKKLVDKELLEDGPETLPLPLLEVTRALRLPFGRLHRASP